MTTDEFIFKLENFRSAMPEVRSRVFLDVVFSAAALVKRRIIGARESASALPFGVYSSPYLKKRIKTGKGPDPRINFSYTGRMWQTTTPVLVHNSPDEVRVRVAPLDPHSNKVMGYHDKKYNEIMTPNKDEIDLIVGLFNEEIQEFINSTIHS